MRKDRRPELNARQKKTDRNNRILLALCCLYMALLTGLFIPSAVISASPAEFVDAHYYQDPARYLIPSSLIGAGVFLIAGFGIGLLLNPWARKRYTTAAAAVAAVSAMNYMLFGRDYGSLSSALKYETAISNPAGTVLMNAACAAAVAVAVVLLRKKHSLILRLICLYGCGALVVMSVMNIDSLRKQAGEVRDITDRIQAEDASFRLDKKGRNVVVIMLDRAISGFVPYMLNEKPELKEQFDGFTWYPNTLSYGYHTNIAAPALFGGYEYTPDGMEERAGLSLKDKHNEALKVMPLNFLEAGYEVTVCDAPYANYQWIPDLSIYDEYPEIRTCNTIGMFDEYKIQMLEYLDHVRSRNLFFYSLFRASPLVLQPVIYDNGRYLEPGGNTGKGEGAELAGVSPDFLNSYMVMKNLDRLTNVTEDGTNTFLMLANEMTHDAVELQKPDYTPRSEVDNSAYNGTLKTEDGQELNLAEAEEIVRIHYDSDMAAMIQLGRWFDELRKQGVYDNTRIIIVSDHGCYLGLFGTDLREKYGDLSSFGYRTDEWTDTMCYNPLLLVKDFGASGFTTDRTFMTNAETPALAFEGTVENPVNPFTGCALTGRAGEAAEHHVVESDWHIADNCGNMYSDPLRITFRGTDVFDPEGWTVGSGNP
jgi:hypothetical protein